MTEVPDRTVLRIETRNETLLADGVQRVFGKPVPAMNKSVRLGEGSALRVAPGVLLLSSEPNRLDAFSPCRKPISAVGSDAAVVDISHGFSIRRFAVAAVLHRLDELCPVDLHEREFHPGDIVRTVIAGHGVLIHRLERPEILDLYTGRSMAASFYHYAAL